MATITRTLSIKTENGDQVFPIRELSFTNLVCDLEGTGIDVVGITSGRLDQTKLFSTVRGLLSVMIGVSLKEAGDLMDTHFKNGGTIDEIFESFTQAMEDSGFGKSPQDHKKPQTATVSRGRKTTKK